MDIEESTSQNLSSVSDMPSLERLGKASPTQDPKESARLLREDYNRVRDTYVRSKEMIEQALSILNRLADRFVVRLADVTELHLDTCFRKEFKI